jgi:hypothetical protein
MPPLSQAMILLDQNLYFFYVRSQALFRQPERPEAFNLLGVLVECTGDWLKSQKFYRAALRQEHDLFFVIPTYRLREVGETVEHCYTAVRPARWRIL